MREVVPVLERPTPKILVLGAVSLLFDMAVEEEVRGEDSILLYAKRARAPTRKSRDA